MAIARSVTISFDTTNLGGALINPAPIEIFVDNVNWTLTPSVLKTNNSIQITFEETYILTQRIVTFKSDTLNSLSIALVKARVYKENDVVVKVVPANSGNFTSLPSYGKKYRPIEGAFTEEFTQTYGTGS